MLYIDEKRKFTKEQADRFQELEQKAINHYLDKTDFDASEWLSKKETKEYLKLLRLLN